MGERLGFELESTAYALDSTTIDLCLSLFPWALFRTTKSAVKMHTRLDLRGNTPTFLHISDGKLGDVKILDVLVERSRYAEKNHPAARRIIVHDHALVHKGVILPNFVEIRQHEYSLINSV